MSRTLEEWNEQREKVLHIRSGLHAVQGLIDDIDAIRFDEVTAGMNLLDNHLEQAITQANELIGRLTLS